MPTLNPVGHQSTNWILLFVLIVAIAAFTSLGTTSPLKNEIFYTQLKYLVCKSYLYNIQQAIYLPWRGSHLTI